jgi:SAM-dependent methyltransferase
MLFRNNRAIDIDILCRRVSLELSLLKAVPQTGVAREATGVAQEAMGARRPISGIADGIKRVPILGGVAVWIVSILRARQIERAAFAANAGLQQVNGRVSSFEKRIGASEARCGGLEARFNSLEHLQGALVDLRNSLDTASRAWRDQTEAIRREIMFQQRRLSRISEMGGTSAACREAMGAVRDQRLDSLYEAFEDRYRGTRADIKQRLVTYLDRLKLSGAGQTDAPIVDVGCGRGEWLELLRENGLTAYGIDVNIMMVERSVSLGLDARHADLVTHLRSLDDRSRSALTAFHVVEHLQFETLVDFLDEALRVLVPGGMLILETPNPENMRVGATTFYNDPTHRNPIPPEPLRFIVEHRGFSDVEIVRLHPSPQSEWLKGEEWNISHLNTLLFGPRDYAIIARLL